MESNSYFSIKFYSNEHNYSKLSYLFNRMTPIFNLATTPSNQQNQQKWSRQCRLKTKRSLIWSTKYWKSYNRNHNSAVP